MSNAKTGRFTFTGADYDAVRELIGQRAGIELGDDKRDMVYARLSRRLRTLGLREFSDYIALIGTDDCELEQFTNSITTNLTSFFRESYQLDVFASRIVPELLKQNASQRTLRIWSAGCSTGQEPYTLAIILNEVIPDITSWSVKILATDLDTNVLETATNGVYPDETIADLTLERKKRWFRPEAGSDVRVAPDLQRMIHFRQLNFMNEWPFRGPFDAIFCRNVLIYFDHPTQMWLIDRFGKVLSPTGHLLLGHSEALRGRQTDQFVARGQNTFQKIVAGSAETRPAQPRPLFGFSHLERYWDEEFQQYAARIKPGEYYVTRDDEVITTVLGSCISVCMRDPVSRIGGMNRFMLPASPRGGSYSLTAAANSYGNYVMEQLVNEILKHGGVKRQFEIKVFGGSQILANVKNLGDLSIDFIRRYLGEERLNVSSQDLAGTAPRKVCYSPRTGRVRIKKLDPRFSAKLHARELAYVEQVASEPITGDVELF